MVLFGLVFALQTDIVHDARLSKPTDFDVSLRQITDFCADISKSSGVTLSVAKNLVDLKVDVYVDGKSTRETLDKVAKALNCDWVATENGYQLQMDAKNVNRERNFNRAEDDEELRWLKLTLRGRQYVSTFFPPTQERRKVGQGFFTAELRNKITGPYEKEYRAAEEAKDPGRMRSAYEKWATVESSLGDFMIGRVMSQFDKSALERFWKGDPFVASTDPAAQYKLFPSDIELYGTSSYFGEDGKTHEADYQSFSFFRFDPLANRIRMNMITYSITPGGYGANKGGGGFAYSSTSNPVSEGLKTLPFYVDLVPWMDQEATPKKFSQAIDKNTKEWKSPHLNHRRRLGDHLRWFHQATGIPVVAQADRSCTWYWIKLNRGFDSASQYVEAMMKDNELLAKEDNGYLVARNFRYWRHRRHEAPEALWAKFESISEDKPLTMQDFVKAAQAFREDQLLSQEIGYPLSGFDTGSVISSYDSLRLFGALAPDQQKLALDKGISISDVGSAQQQQMVDTVIKLILDSGTPSLELSKALITKGMAASQFGSLLFRIQLTEFPEQNFYSDELKEGGIVLEKQGMTKHAASHFAFNYSIGPKETVSQAMQIKK